MTRVLIVEDHLIVARGLELGLGAEGFEVRSTDGAPDTLPGLLAGFRPDVVLLDLYLADGRSGIDLLPTLHAPGRSVVVLTSETDPTVLARALEAGADAALGKTIPFPRLVWAVRALAGGRSAEAEQNRHEVTQAALASARERARRLAPFASLTQREEQVLAMLIDGARAADIAERLYVSLSTVRFQIRSIFTKLGVGSQLAAVSMAIKAGWAPEHHKPPGHS